ncbi:MAG: hypothetical protein AAB373_03760 [Patescibacteria group bacterium]
MKNHNSNLVSTPEGEKVNDINLHLEPSPSTGEAANEVSGELTQIKEKDNLSEKLKKLQGEFKNLSNDKTHLITKLAEMVTGGFDEKDLEGFFTTITDFEKRMKEVETEIFKTMSGLAQLNLIQLANEVKRLKSSNQEEKADRLMLAGFEKYGDVVKKQMGKEYISALGRLTAKNKLSDFENNLHYGNLLFPLFAQDQAFSQQKALDWAINYKTGLGMSGDILDQIRYSEKTPYAHRPKLDTYSQLYSQEESAAKSEIKLKSRISERGMKIPMPEAQNIIISTTPEFQGQPLEIHPYGWLPDFKYELTNLQLPSGKVYKGLRVMPEVKELLAKPQLEGIRLVLIREPADIKLSKPYLEVSKDKSNMVDPRSEVRIVESYDYLYVSDFAYAKEDKDGTLRIWGIDGKKITNYDAKKIEDLNQTATKNVLKVLDLNKNISSLSQAAGKIGGSLENLSKLFSAGAESDKPENLVDYMRNGAKNILMILEDNSLKADLKVAKDFLVQLKSLKMGSANSPLEKELSSRIEALECFIQLFENQELINMLKTILDKSKFHTANFANWLRYNGAKMLVSIVTASLAVASIIATFGATAPTWVLAATATFSGMTGYELAAEGLYQLRSASDEYYKDRSLLGSWVADEQIYDPKTKSYINMEFTKDIAIPYLKNFTVGFVSGLAAVGLGQLAAKYLSAMVQKSDFMQTFLRDQIASSKILNHLIKIKEIIPKIPIEQLNNPNIKTIVSQIEGDLREEAWTMGLEETLSNLEEHLGSFSKFLVVTTKSLNFFETEA